MITGTAELRVLMRRIYQQHGCASFVSAMLDIGQELDRESRRIGPPSLADIIDLGDYRRSRRRRNETGPGAA